MKYLKNFLPFVGKFSQKTSILAVLVCAFVITTSSTQAFDGRAVDYSRSYGFGGVLRAPNGGDPVPNSRNIIDVNGNVEASGVLGCSGLDLDALVEGQLGGMGNIGDLSKDIANAAKTRMFNEALTQLFSDPQVASVLEGMQGMAQARIGMLQKNCDASQIYADATNKRLRAEAVSRCVAERRSMEDCSQADILTNYLEQVVESPRWSEPLHEQLCDEESQDNCEWTLMVPNKRTQIGDGGETPAEDPDESDPDDETAEEETPDDASDEGAITPAAADGEEVPAALRAADIYDLASSAALSTIIDRVAAAEFAVELLGYSGAMRAALYNQAGFPPELQEALNRRNENLAEENESTGNRLQGRIYTVYDSMQDQSCEYSLTENDFSADLADVIGSSGGGAALPPAAPTPPPAAPTPPSDDDADEPAPAASEPPPSSGRIFFPIRGQSRAEAYVTDRYRAPRPWCINGRTSAGKGCSKPHRGVDYRARYVHLVAPFDAVIQERRDRGGLISFYSPQYGEMKYRHLDSFARGMNPGIPVRGGQDIGISGNRGSGAPHLHVELWRNGVDVNPEIVLGGTIASSGETYSGDGPHGSVPLAQERTTLPPDHPFVIALQEKMDKMAIRTSNTATCYMKRNFHPQIYVKAAMLEGGIFMSEEELSEENNEQSPDINLNGEKGGFILEMAQTIGRDAVVASYNSTIKEIAEALALKSTDGEAGMNPPLYEYARGQVALLKFARSTAITDYATSCELANTRMNITARNDELSRTSKARSRYEYTQNRPEINYLNCNKYDLLVDDGIKDLRDLYSGLRSSGAMAPNNSSMPVDPDQETNCLALNIYHEARGESAAGQEAVARVTMARRDHGSYPGSICGVVYQNNQFSWTNDRASDNANEADAWRRALETARRVQEQGTPPEYSNITAYHTTDCTSSGCNAMRNNPLLEEAFRVGNHVFYRERG